MGRDWENLGKHDSKSLDFLEQTAGKSEGVNDSADVDSQGNEEYGRENT